jgi:hypothetical protein
VSERVRKKTHTHTHTWETHALSNVESSEVAKLNTLDLQLVMKPVKQKWIEEELAELLATGFIRLTG